MTPFIERAVKERTLGLALHYPLLHAAVLGLGARRTLEFGAGGSTRVFLDSLSHGAVHVSVSGETESEILDRYFADVWVSRRGARQPADPRPSAPPPIGSAASVADWFHHCGTSESFRDIDPGPLDLILHDGSHAADVVAADIAWAWPFLKCYGLLLVHDTQHSYVGAEVRAGLRRGLEQARAIGTAIGEGDRIMADNAFSMTTLPYGFGLTIVRRERGVPGEVVPAVAKVGSPHKTELVELWP